MILMISISNHLENDDFDFELIFNA